MQFLLFVLPDTQVLVRQTKDDPLRCLAVLSMRMRKYRKQTSFAGLVDGEKYLNMFR